MVLLDTHIWLWWLIDDGPLNPDYREQLHLLAANKKIALSVASVWETEMLDRKGRIELKYDFQKWIHIATHPDHCTLLPIDTALILAQRRLPDDFHTDPADRLITASSLLAEIPLATMDKRIINSGIVSIWNGN